MSSSNTHLLVDAPPYTQSSDARSIEKPPPLLPLLMRSDRHAA